MKECCKNECLLALGCLYREFMHRRLGADPWPLLEVGEIKGIFEEEYEDAVRIVEAEFKDNNE